MNRDNKIGYKSGSLTITKFERNYDNKSLCYRFINAFPTNVEGFTVTQEPDAVFPEKTVTFTFTNYEQY